MKYLKEKMLMYSLLAQGKLKKAKKLKRHLLERTLKRKRNGKDFSSKHIIK
jgi:hypothetical protein